MAEPAPEPAAPSRTSAPERARLPLAVGLTITGATIALGYLVGGVRGPIVAVVGGIALMTLGRALGRGGPESALLCASFVILAGAWSVAAMRWSSLVLSDVRGAQGVLGQTLLVGSTELVIGVACAAAAAVLALAVWAASPPVGGRAVWVRASESLPPALATTTAFWGSAVPAGGLAALGEWILALALLSGAAALGARFARGVAARRALLGGAFVALLVGAGLVARGL